MEVTFSPLFLWLVCEGYAHQFHYSPNYVKHCWNNDANEQKQEGVIYNALHDWNAFRLLGGRGFLIHYNYLPEWIVIYLNHICSQLNINRKFLKVYDIDQLKL